MKIGSFLLFFICIHSLCAQVWVSDRGDGPYKNPVLYADYSDPDVIRVGCDYYMTASSLHCVPGLPILYSSDLVNWKIVNGVLKYLKPEGIPEGFFDKPQHGEASGLPVSGITRVNV